MKEMIELVTSKFAKTTNTNASKHGHAASSH